MVEIHYLPEFLRRAKILAKKYKTFAADYAKLLESLESNPFLGTHLGNGVYKVRMSISAKGKGKSGGARVLTFTVDNKSEDKIVVTLLTIYDKNEISNVTDQYIEWLVGQIPQPLTPNR